MSMSDRVRVLVTGASSGIGQATAVEFARRGHRVFAAARTHSAVAEMSANTPGLTGVTMDVTDAGSVAQGWARIEAETGGAGVDVLVNNAGFALTGPLETLSGEDIQRQFATNVFGLLAVTRTVLPGMRARRNGRIINVSSVLGRFSMAGVGAYAATKYAVEAISDALRLELAGFGIKVVIVEPGFVATNIGVASDAQPSADAPIPEAYQDLVAKGDRYMAAQLAKAMAPTVVANAIVNAAAKTKPRPRYLVPGRIAPQVKLLTWLPVGLADRAKRGAMGIG
jgi:NAD(P)-dependent dehydrogenase (short-subunit alcohol dehydrogenase family)